MIKYYKNNKLAINIKKTQIMIVSDNREVKNGTIDVKNIKIKNKEEIKILGTMFHNSLKWNHHLNEGSYSRIYQLRKRAAEIRSIAKTFSWRFIIFVYWVIFGYIYTGTFTGAGILGVGSIVPLFFYYFHERIWNKVKWGTG